MPKVHLPASLRHSISAGSAPVELEGATVREVLSALAERHPSLGPTIFDASGKPSRYLAIFLRGEQLRGQSGLDASVSLEDELTLLLAVAGG